MPKPKPKPTTTEEIAEVENDACLDETKSEGRFRIHLFSRDEIVTKGPHAGKATSCNYDMVFDGMNWIVDRNGIAQWYYAKPEHAAQRLVELGVEHCESLEKLQEILDTFTKTLVKSLEAVPSKVPA